MAQEIEHKTRALATGEPLAPRIVTRYVDEESIAYAAATRLLLTLGDLLATPGHDRADIAVTGGTDGIRVLEVMGTNPLARSIEWSRVHFWWGDERFVAADDDDRNAKQAREALLNNLVTSGALPESNIHEMPADTRSADQRAAATDADNQVAADAAAVAYEHELRRELGENPQLDIALFGVGPDAHFASLFPGHEEVKIVDGRLACGVINSPKPPSLRVSLTVPMIQHSHRVWAIASSDRKRDAIAKALVAVNDPMVPVSHAAGEDGTVWMVDTLAAPVE